MRVPLTVNSACRKIHCFGAEVWQWGETKTSAVSVRFRALSVRSRAPGRKVLAQLVVSQVLQKFVRWFCCTGSYCPKFETRSFLKTFSKKAAN